MRDKFNGGESREESGISQELLAPKIFRNVRKGIRRIFLVFLCKHFLSNAIKMYHDHLERSMLCGRYSHYINSKNVTMCKLGLPDLNYVILRKQKLVQYLASSLKSETSIKKARTFFLLQEEFFTKFSTVEK